MRDLLGWNLPLGRWAGVQVRVHAFFLLLAILALWMSRQKDPSGELMAQAAVALGILFASVLAHEFGHCFVARRMGGRVDQVILWPLGGLVPINLSHQPQEELVTAAAGPLVNASLATAAMPILLLGGHDVLGTLNPLIAPQTVDGITWVYCLQLTVWINLILTWVNLLPAYPLDGGRVLRSIVWRRQGYRTAVIFVARVAKLTALATWVAAILIYSSYPDATLPLLLLGVLLFFSAKQETERLQDRDADDELFGYDFSQGYTSLEKTFESPPRRGAGIVRQWLDNRREARRIRQLQIEQEDDLRVDEVLARLHELGRDALSDDDRALLDRVSERYRNRQR